LAVLDTTTVTDALPVSGGGVAMFPLEPQPVEKIAAATITIKRMENT